MKIYSSQSEKGFFIEGINSFIPEDATEIEYSVYETLLSENQTQNKQIDFTVFPPVARENIKTLEELISAAEQKQAALVDEARYIISVWQTKLVLGRISEEERGSLNLWIDYIDALEAVDITMGADIVWPVRPEEKD